MSFDAEMQIRKAIDEWAIYRDTGDWQKFLNLWHPKGWMRATWFDGSVQDFVEQSKQSFGRGALAHHVLGGTAVTIAGDRALATTRMTLHLRVPIDGIVCDISCLGLFVDFLIAQSGQWVFALRQPVYEKDQLIPCTPGQAPDLDRQLLASLPEGYRHLAYAQTQAGMTVDTGLPGTSGVEAERLKLKSTSWLEGGAVEEFLFQEPQQG